MAQRRDFIDTANAARLLPTVPGLSLGGGTYLDEAGKEHEFVFVMSDKDPGKTRVVNGKVVEVWWVQTSPPDPSAWYPKSPTFDLAAQTYTIPTDDGATYSVHGVTTAAGTYRVTAPDTVNINANPKSGYSFASDATVAWSKVYEEKPLAMDAAASALNIPYYYRLDDAAGTKPPKNRGSASDNPLWGNASWTALGATPAAGVGVTAFAPTSPTAAGLTDGTQLTALTVAAAVNVQGANPGFRLTWDWNTKKTAQFAGLTPGIHHVAVTFDGTTKRTYLDGALRAETAEGLPTSAALRLCAPDDGATVTTSTFAGLVVDKSRALSAAQIKQLSDAVTR